LSSHRGPVRAGEVLSPERRYESFTRVGFGEATGVGFPGESSGVVHPVDEWDGRTKYTVMFGQGMTATAVQTTAAMAAIANGGVLPDSQLVDGTVDASEIGRASCRESV